MTVPGGFGVVLKINTGSLTTVANLLDVEFPEQDRVLAEARYHNSTDGYMEYVSTGLRMLSEMTCVLGWDINESTHAQFITSYDAETSVGMSIEDSAGQEVIAFNAFIKTIGRESRQEDLFKATITIQPTGAPTIT